jgi:hypothetical protein
VCTDTFTKGSGNSLITFCVSGNGNVVQLAFKGVEQIRVGTFSEGYTLCVGGVVKAYDLADPGESGFQAATRTQPGGPNTLPLTITRKTNDNTISVAQTYSFTTDSVSVSTSFTNLTAATIANVKYVRMADLDANNSFGGDTFSRSQDSITASEDGQVSIMMGNASYGQTRTYAAIAALPFATCAPVSDPTPVAEDAAAYQTFALNNLLPGTPKTSVVVYRRL